MRLFIFLVFFLYLYVEISLFMSVASIFGVAISMILILLSSVLGVSMIKSMGKNTLQQLMQKTSNGQDPVNEVANSLLLLISGFLLFLPGFFTTFLGLLLLLVSPIIIKYFKAVPFLSFSQRFTSHSDPNSDPTHHSTTIDGEFKRKDDDD